MFKNQYINNTYEIVLFFLLLIAIGFNIFPFQLVNPKTRMAGYPAIFWLADAPVAGGETIAHRRGLYLALGQVAPGVVLILPTGTSLDIAQFYGLSRTKEIVYKNYNPETFFQDVDLSKYIVENFNASKKIGPGSFAIAKRKEKPTSMILLRRNNKWYLVDWSILPISGN